MVGNGVEKRGYVQFPRSGGPSRPLSKLIDAAGGHARTKGGLKTQTADDARLPRRCAERTSLLADSRQASISASVRGWVMSVVRFSGRATGHSASSGFSARWSRLVRTHALPPPRPALDVWHESRSNCIPLDVATDCQEMLIRLPRKRLEGALVQVATADTVAVQMPPPDMRCRQPVHERGEVAISARKAPGHAVSEGLKTLGDHLWERRLELGTLQQEVARGLGVSTTSVWQWENNDTAPKVYLIPRIHDFLDYALWAPPNGFASSLSQARRGIGLSRLTLAARIGVYPTTVDRWERGQGRPMAASRRRLREWIVTC
ncbi:MAG: helix-turn-helix domain-containing protein [Candidatus Binatia bacterium]